MKKAQPLRERMAVLINAIKADTSNLHPDMGTAVIAAIIVEFPNVTFAEIGEAARELGLKCHEVCGELEMIPHVLN